MADSFKVRQQPCGGWGASGLEWCLPSAAAPAAASCSFLAFLALTNPAWADASLLPRCCFLCSRSPQAEPPTKHPRFIPRNGFLFAFSASAAVLLPSPPSPYRLQPAQQNPLSELPISSWSFACFLTSGSRQAQAEISDMETQRNPHTQLGVLNWLAGLNK